jgi:hypothetical protein
LKLFFWFLFSVALALGAAAQSTPPAGTQSVTSKSSNAKPLSKEQARQKFVRDVVHSAVALPQPDPQDRLRVLSAAVGVIAPIDQKLARQYAKEGTAIEARLVTEGQQPAVSMMSSGYVDCASAVIFVESIPPNAVADADQALVGAISACPKQVNEAAKHTLEAGMEQGVVAGRPILALMNSEGMDSPWSRTMFVEMFSSLPTDAASFAHEAPNYAAMYSQLAHQIDKEVVKTAGTKFLLWLATLTDSPQRNVAVNLTTSALSSVLGAPAQDMLRSDVTLQQLINTAVGKDTVLPPPDESSQSVNVSGATGNTSDRTGQSMSASQRAKEAAASGLASGTSGDLKSAEHYFDVAFASIDEVWLERANSAVNAPVVVQEVSEAAAKVDPVMALERSQRLQEPSAEAISMLAVARVVANE